MHVAFAVLLLALVAPRVVAGAETGDAHVATADVETDSRAVRPAPAPVVADRAEARGAGGGPAAQAARPPRARLGDARRPGRHPGTTTAGGAERCARLCVWRC